jgi:hypothetical protein
LDDLNSKNLSAQLATPNIQRYILALLYLNNGGDGWIYNEKWMTSTHECNWYGVSCSTYQGIVDKIDLSKSNLTGFLPSELGELRGLEYLVRLKTSILMIIWLLTFMINSTQES